VSDPALALQGALIAAMKAAAGVVALVSTRVYDNPPSTSTGAVATFPYITIGEAQSIPQRADCIDGTEHFVAVHAWSRAVGFTEVKRIASAVRAALHEAEPAVAGYRLIDLAVQDTRFLRDPDGLTSHSVVNLRAVLDAID
jgi:hypothetical protein